VGSSRHRINCGPRGTGRQNREVLRRPLDGVARKMAPAVTAEAWSSELRVPRLSFRWQQGPPRIC
jgi:hypothetical protein